MYASNKTASEYIELNLEKTKRQTQNTAIVFNIPPSLTDRIKTEKIH